MEGPCQLPASAWSLLPSLPHLPPLPTAALGGGESSARWLGGGQQQHKLVDSFILLYKHGNGENKEREEVGFGACH